MISHALKSWPANFDAIKNGFVHATVRAEEDRTFNVGDELVFWLAAGPKDPAGLEEGTLIPGAPIRATITAITRDAGPLALFGVKLSDGSSPGKLARVAVLHFRTDSIPGGT